MLKSSLTILEPADGGDPEVIAISKDAAVCVDAYYGCDEPGRVYLIRFGSLEFEKTNTAKPVAKKKAVKKA